jgi:hypothetical protein
MINLSTSSRVKIADVSILASQCSIAALTTFLPCDFEGTFAPASLASGTTWNVRNLDRVQEYGDLCAKKLGKTVSFP